MPERTRELQRDREACWKGVLGNPWGCREVESRLANTPRAKTAATRMPLSHTVL